MGHWRDYAKCRGLDPEIFFPSDEDESESEDAARVCLHLLLKNCRHLLYIGGCGRSSPAWFHTPDSRLLAAVDL